MVRFCVLYFSIALMLMSCSQSSSPVTHLYSGLIVYTSDRNGNKDIFTMAPDGSHQVQRTHDTSNEFAPVWSPDGKEIAFISDRSGNHDIYIMDVHGTKLRRITTNEAMDDAPAWSPDGRNIAFVSDRTGKYDLFVVDINSGKETRVANQSSQARSPTWSRDGHLLMAALEYDGKNYLYTMNVDGSNVARVTNESSTEWGGEWSSDGRNVAYKSFKIIDYVLFQQAKDRIQVMDIASKTIVSVSNGGEQSSPTWSPQDDALAYASFEDGNNHIFVVDVSSGEHFQITEGSFNNADPDWSPK